jgi:hypothetical protein
MTSWYAWQKHRSLPSLEQVLSVATKVVALQMIRDHIKQLICRTVRGYIHFFRGAENSRFRRGDVDVTVGRRPVAGSSELSTVADMKFMVADAYDTRTNITPERLDIGLFNAATEYKRHLSLNLCAAVGVMTL